MAKNYSLKEIQKRIKPVLEKYPVIACWIFGSQVEKKKITPLSDFDFAVQLSEKTKKSKYFDIKIKLLSDLMGALKTNKVDLVVINEPKIPLLLKFNIIRGKVLYCKNRRKKAYLEFEIMKNWFDWEYFEKLWGDIFVSQVAKGVI